MSVFIFLLIFLLRSPQVHGDVALDCAPVPVGGDYDHHLWWNADGSLYGASVEEDSCIVLASIDPGQ